MTGKVVAVCTSRKKGEQKQLIATGHLVRGHGLEGDVHAGNWHRQVSFLAQEDIESLRREGLELDHGAFAENIIVAGFDLAGLEIGRRFRVGDGAVVQVTQIGKECHAPCAIFHKAGRCIMPERGIFTRVIRSGTVKESDPVAIDAALDTYRLGILTISDKGSRGERPDGAGPRIADMMDGKVRGTVVAKAIVADDRRCIAETLVDWSDREVCDLIITAGGTGLSPRDVTPEATLDCIDRQVPGIAEAMRAAGLAHTPRAMLSRGICGQRGQTLILNLSGSPKAVGEQLGAILPVLSHALETATGIPIECAR